MSTARFHVFSGTGNGRSIARELSARLGLRGFSTEMLEVSFRSIEKGSATISRGEGDLDIFIFPVYAMSVPRIMARYAAGLGRAGRQGGAPRAAVLSVNGRISPERRDGHEGQALAQAERVLRRRGWDVRYRETFDYPQNVTSIGSAQDAETRAAIVSLMAPRLETVAEELAAGLRRKRPCPAWAHILGWPFGWLYRIFGRRAWGLLFAADERCDGCGLCAERCPSGAIRMRGGRPGWSYACEGCERCMNLCPKKAIQASLLRFSLVIGLSIALFRVPPGLREALSSLPGWVPTLGWMGAATLAGFALLRLLDLALVALSRLAFLRPILGFGWTRWTRRYPDPSRGSTDGRP